MVNKICVIFGFFSILFFASTVFAVPTLPPTCFEWDANTETDLAGYELHWRMNNLASVFDDINMHIIADPLDTDVCFTEINPLKLPNHENMIYALAAYDTSGNVSGYSNEVLVLPFGEVVPGIPGNLRIQINIIITIP